MRNKFLSFFLLVSISVAAQSDYTTQIKRLISENPALASEKANLESEIANYKSENTLSGPEIEGGLLFPQNGGEKRWDAGISQSFDWPGLYRTRGKIAKYKADAFRMLYRSTYLEKALEAKLLLVDYAKAVAELDLLNRSRANLSNIAEAYKKSYDSGQATILDIKKLQIENFSLSNRIAEAEAARDIIAASLRAIGGETAVIPESWSFPTENLRSESYYIEQLVNNDPTIAANENLTLSSAMEIGAARQSALPSFSVGFRHAFEEGTHFNGFSIAFGLPTWSNRNKLAAATAQAEYLRLSNIDYTLRVRSELSADYTQAVRLEKRISSAKTIFEVSDYPDLLKKSLEGRAITLIDYLREFNLYIDAEMEYINLRHSYCTAVSRLNRFDLLSDD